MRREESILNLFEIAGNNMYADWKSAISSRIHNIYSCHPLSILSNYISPGRIYFQDGQQPAARARRSVQGCKRPAPPAARDAGSGKRRHMQTQSDTAILIHLKIKSHGRTSSDQTRQLYYDACNDNPPICAGQVISDTTIGLRSTIFCS